MSRRVSWRRRAQAELDQIAHRMPGMAGRIRDAIARYSDTELGDVQKLSAREGIYRLRVGDWRILFTLDDGGQTLVIQRVLNRRDAYR